MLNKKALQPSACRQYYMDGRDMGREEVHKWGEIEGQRRIWRGENEGELEQNIFMIYLYKILPKMNIKSHFQTPKYSITYLCN